MKQIHWRDWLEKAEDPDIWTVHRLISSPASDGGSSRIPGLKYKDPADNEEKTAANNEEKSRALAATFFPEKPPANTSAEPSSYPPQCEKPMKITKEQIIRQLGRLKLYKAPSPDGIPNIVLTKCATIIVDRLLHIFSAILECNFQYRPWKQFTTVVLRKPGKPRYDLPKVYHPIALLNTMLKVLVAIIADHLSHLTEKHQLLPAHHFGGRPG